MRHKPKRAKPQPSVHSSGARRMMLIGGLVIIAVLAYEQFTKEAPKRGTVRPTSKAALPIDPEFRKDGELSFIRAESGEIIKRINIEIAEAIEDRSRGLMYRTSIPDSVGMLFIFRSSKPQSFWMKNTLIPLDIVYINENKQIVKIRKNNLPLSEESIPSLEQAMFVVEVAAGFCDRYALQEGDLIAFTRTNETKSDDHKNGAGS